MQALDFIVYCARVHGIRLILALGNFWHAYKSPEEFVDYAMGSGGHDILDFYREPAVRQLFRSHISTILTRVNRFTGLEYKDDPTIMGYDVMNEPRCPGAWLLLPRILLWCNSVVTMHAHHDGTGISPHATAPFMAHTVSGCESAELQNLVVGWMDEMTRHAKVIAPRQLMALGTEVGGAD
jgi:endo-1,4-beta-mannosidase